MILWICCLIIGCLIGLIIGLAISLWINSREEKLGDYGYVDEDYLRECGFSPTECARYHLPGDCPLCGAK